MLEAYYEDECSELTLSWVDRVEVRVQQSDYHDFGPPSACQFENGNFPHQW